MSVPAEFHPLVTIGLVILYGLALMNCVRVLGERVSSGAAIAWIFINLSLPMVGVPLYLLVGNLRIRGYVKRHKAGVKALEQIDSSPTLAPPVDPTDLVESLRERVQSFKTLFSRFGDPLFDPQHGACDLLIDGSSTFDAIFGAIAGAKRYILVQYYIVRSDRLGLELQRLLIEKARAGIPVYLLYDDMGSFWLKGQYINDLRAAGVRVARFLPVASFKRVFQLNFRNHRKLVVVDGEVAFTGGLNVGEEYATRRLRRRMKDDPKGPHRMYWRDTHARVTGGIVGRMEDLFLEDWFFATEELVNIDSPPQPTVTATTGTVLQFIPTGPTDDALISVLFLMHLINSAKKRLWIATPYFVPDAALARALELAALRGVDVRIILPKVSDNRVVHWVSILYAELLQARGAIVLLYEAGFMHQKVILVDDDTAAVGTMNLDNRALYFNFEMMVLIFSQEFAGRVAAMIQKDFISCRFLTQDKRRWFRAVKKWRGNAARLLSPLL